MTREEEVAKMAKEIKVQLINCICEEVIKKHGDNIKTQDAITEALTCILAYDFSKSYLNGEYEDGSIDSVLELALNGFKERFYSAVSRRKKMRDLGMLGEEPRA